MHGWTVQIMSWGCILLFTTCSPTSQFGFVTLGLNGRNSCPYFIHTPFAAHATPPPPPPPPPEMPAPTAPSRPPPIHPTPISTTTTRSLAILGAGGHGRSVADVAETCGWRVHMYDDGVWPATTASGPWPVVGNLDTLITRLDEYVGAVVAIGDCTVRLRAARHLQACGAHLPPLVHPSAWVSPHAKPLGAGSVVLAGAVINVGALVGDACIVNTGATVDHDCDLAAGVHISPGAHLAGSVTVGECTWVGVGATVKQGVCLGSHAVAGAGAVVVNRVPEGACVVGCPAKPIEEKKTASGRKKSGTHACAWPRLACCWRRTGPGL